jgi:hypothetical protein
MPVLTALIIGNTPTPRGHRGARPVKEALWVATAHDGRSVDGAPTLAKSRQRRGACPRLLPIGGLPWQFEARRSRKKGPGIIARSLGGAVLDAGDGGQHRTVSLTKRSQNVPGISGNFVGVQVKREGPDPENAGIGGHRRSQLCPRWKEPTNWQSYKVCAVMATATLISIKGHHSPNSCRDQRTADVRPNPGERAARVQARAVRHALRRAGSNPRG